MPKDKCKPTADKSSGTIKKFDKLQGWRVFCQIYGNVETIMIRFPTP